MSVTSFSRLAPHRGMFPVVGVGVGNSDMRGGFSWSGLFSGISSGLNRVGNFIGNTARQVGNSQAFQQVKNGVIQSGVLENAGNLAGSAVSGLVDVGRIKLEHDLQKLRDKAIGAIPRGPVPIEIPQKPIYDYNDIQVVDKPLPPSTKVDIVPPISNGIDKSVVDDNVSTPPEAVPLGPYIPPSDQPSRAPSPSSGRRPRKRRRTTSGWGAALNGMMGYGPGFYKRRYCF